MAYQRIYQCWAIVKFSTTISIIRLNKTTHYSHAWTHIARSSRLIIIISSRWMEVSSLGSRPNNKKYCEKNANEVYQLNLYPMANHGNFESQFQMWPFWRPYFYNPHFTIYTIHLVNLSTSKWSHEVVWWSINAFPHKSYKSPWNSIPWLVKTLVGTSSLLNIMSINAYVAPSLLWFGKGTNSNHLKKCSIITKT